ncbi:hypothetical protein, partial [Streptomyces sp. NPDC020362]|uniref:hypothetical protein n=1 Tax=Streptomyces sp. NPDC020362 TaxID=3154486 RepID=UPI0033C0E893
GAVLLGGGVGDHKELVAAEVHDDPGVWGWTRVPVARSSSPGWMPVSSSCVIRGPSGPAHDRVVGVRGDPWPKS